MFFCPLQNWRHIKVTDRRTKVDYAQCMRDLVDELLPDAVRIRVVQDNLNTHTPAALYEVLRLRKPSALWINWSSTTRPSTGVG
jgi:hypothetical protein